MLLLTRKEITTMFKKIKCSNGEWCNDPKDIKDSIVHHFNFAFNKLCPSIINLNLNIIPSLINDKMNDMLYKTHLVSEIWEILMSMNIDYVVRLNSLILVSLKRIGTLLKMI